MCVYTYIRWQLAGLCSSHLGPGNGEAQLFKVGEIISGLKKIVHIFMDSRDWIVSVVLYCHNVHSYICWLDT